MHSKLPQPAQQLLNLPLLQEAQELPSQPPATPKHRQALFKRQNPVNLVIPMQTAVTVQDAVRVCGLVVVE